MDKKKNILVLSIHATLDNRIAKYIGTIRKAGYSVTYINSHNDDHELQYRDVTHVNTREAFRRLNAFGVLRALSIMRKQVISGDYCLVHIHDPILLVLSYCAKKNGVKVVYDRHESYETIGGFIGKTGNLFERLFKNKIDAVVYVNEMQRLYLESHGFTVPIVCIPNYQSRAAFDLAEHEKMTDMDQRVRSEIQLIYFGGLTDATRNTSSMLSAVENVLQKHQNINVLLGGSCEDTQILQKMKELALRCDRFAYCGLINYREVVNYTVQSDIGMYFQKDVQNNRMSSPNKIYEYLMAGVAICAQGRFTDWDTIHGKAGIVMDYDADAKDIENALNAMIEDKDLLAAYKRASKQLGHLYEWENVEGRYTALYQKLLHAKDE